MTHLIEAIPTAGLDLKRTRVTDVQELRDRPVFGGSCSYSNTGE
jgi:hypothetical protein